MKSVSWLRRLRNGRRWIGLPLLLGIWVIASPGEGTNIVDTRLYKLLHDTYRAPYLDHAMETATRLGNRETLLASSLILATYGGKRERETAKLLTTSLAGSQLLVSGIKFITNRPRPDGRLSPRSNSSFPSGHAAGAFAVATVLANRYRFSLPLFYSGASTVGISRIYLGRHFPSDVVTGALIGYVGSKLVLHFQERILRTKFSWNVEIYLTTPLFFVSLQETD